MKRKDMWHYRTGFKHFKMAPYGSRYSWHKERFIVTPPDGYNFVNGHRGTISLSWVAAPDDFPGPWMVRNRHWAFTMGPK